MSEQNRIPQHVAIIMDGNGRWAELRGKERYEGHVAGVEPVRASLRAAARWGVKYLTLYAFSTENWGRPTHEVDALMELFCKSVVNETPELIRQGVEIRMIGDRTRFSEKVQRYLCEAEQRTAGGKTLTLILALNYSSRSEITRAVQRIAEAKVAMPWHVVLLKGIGANWFVCLAVWLAASAKTMLAKMAGCWLPVMAFVALGYEHSIANMFFIPIGMLEGADVTLHQFFIANLLPATIGNIIGGALLVGTAYTYVNRSK